MTTSDSYEESSSRSFYPYQLRDAVIVLERLEKLDDALPMSSYIHSGEITLANDGCEPWGRLWWDTESESWRLEKIADA